MNLKKPIRKCSREGKIAGVCAGLSKWLEVDASIVRLLFAISLAFGGLGALIYLILWCILDDESLYTSNTTEKKEEKNVDLKKEDK